MGEGGDGLRVDDRVVALANIPVPGKKAPKTTEAPKTSESEGGETPTAAPPVEEFAVAQGDAGYIDSVVKGGSAVKVTWDQRRDGVEEAFEVPLKMIGKYEETIPP